MTGGVPQLFRLILLGHTSCLAHSELLQRNSCLQARAEVIQQAYRHCAYAQSSCRAAAAVCAHPLQLSGTLYANASLKRNHHHERAAATALLLRQDDCIVSVQLSQVRQQSVCVRPKYIVARCVTAALYLATDIMQRCNPLGVCSPETIMNGSRLAAGDHSLASRIAAIHTTAVPCSESLQHADSPCRALFAGWKLSAASALELLLSLNASQRLVSV